MDIFVWSPSYSVGVMRLDDQHKQIIDLINRLGSGQFSVESETISDLLTLLTRYASEHFQEEESLLEKHGYPNFELQKKEHREYRFKIVEMCQETMVRKSSVPEDLLQFLIDWWRSHILESDMAYKEFLNERGVS